MLGQAESVSSKGSLQGTRFQPASAQLFSRSITRTDTQLERWALDILEGASGFEVTTIAGKIDWSEALKDFGTDFNITRMTVKNHGCCGHIFSTIDAALELQKTHKIAADQIIEIRVDTYQTALEMVGNAKVQTEFEGKFSSPFCAASALIHGSIRLDAYRPKRLADRKVHALINRITLSADFALPANHPHQRSSRVRVEMLDGSSPKHLLTHRKSDPELPLTDTELAEKYYELAIPEIGQTVANTLKSRISNIECAVRGPMATTWPGIRSSSYAP